MNSEIVKSQPSNGAVVQLQQWTREQIDLIKRTVMPNDATDDELKLFLHVAARSGLDPMQKQIYAQKRGGKLVTMAGIDGLQARAEKFPDYKGILHGVVCAKDEFVFDAAAGVVLKHSYNAFADRGATLGAWATVQRAGMLPFTVALKFVEYNQSSNSMWKSMPTVMIDKCARHAALRMAFPAQFGGIYEEAEISDSQIGQATVAPPLPPPKPASNVRALPTPTDAEIVPDEPPPSPEELNAALGEDTSAPSPREKACILIEEATSLKGLAALTEKIIELGVQADPVVRDVYGKKQKALKGAA